jgi:spermine/spermidine synthase
MTSHLNRRKADLALISFVLVYLELVVIRWLGTEVRIFSYFKNIPLLAAFLGMGAGCILARRKRDYFRLSPLLLLAVAAVISLAHWGGYTHITFVDPFEHYFLGGFDFTNPPGTVFKGSMVIMGIFILTMALFASLGEKLGQCLNEFSALDGYTVNVAFSLAGILLYALLCTWQTGPAIWLLIASLGLVPFFRKSWAILPLLGAVLFPLIMTPRSVEWSPYYRIELQPVSISDQSGKEYPVGFTVEVNYDGLMGAYNQSEEFVRSLPPDLRPRLLDYYNVSYRIFGPRFKKVMVVGAGAGNDVAAALRNGVSTVDAVEIDPALVDIGKRLHPEKVYDSEKVRIHIGDARTFLRNPEYSNYDMIVFGALDSHSVFSSMSSLRLDNYVYTVESFSQAMDRLGPNGIIAVTFYAFREWQLERVYNALWEANGSKPVVVHSLGGGSDNLVMFAGPGIDRKQLLQHPYVVAQNAEDLVGQRTVEPTTDDWPFLYLQKRGFPVTYASILLLILAVSYMTAIWSTQTSASRFNWLMFFLGVGFMLLETKVLAKVALLVGATWIVNVLVISAVLVMILLANLAVAHGMFKNAWWCLAGLVVSVLLDWWFKLNTLTLINSAVHNLWLVLLLLVVPVFFAGILFSNLFKHEQIPGAALGYNLFGAIVGGVLEYSSMAWGINNLNILAVFAYCMVGLLIFRRSAAATIR